jgi:predicted porin
VNSKPLIRSPMFNLGDFSMKKTLVAMAALAAATSFAQSTATLYGRMDLGYNQSTTTTSTQAGVTAKSKTTELAGGENRRTTSRIGLRGSEDLGGGLKANFNWEARMGGNGASLDDGTSGLGRIRQANMALSGGFGAVVIGTYDNAMDVARGYSQAGNGAGGNLVDDIALTPSKSNNAIGYRSPNFGGMTFSFGTVNNKTTGTDGVGAQTSLAKVSGVQFGLGYANGPLSANFAITNVKQLAGGVVATNAGGKLNEWVGAVKYDLGVAVPYFVYQNGKASGVIAANTAVPGNIKVNSYMLGATFPMGNLTPFIEIGRGSVKDTVGNAAGIIDSGKARAFQLGVLYSLSKRTTIYAQTGSEKVTATTTGVNGFGAVKTSDFNFGVRHDF